MFTLSPNTITSAFGWPLNSDDEKMIHELGCDDLFATYRPIETDISNNSISSSPQLPDFENENIHSPSTAKKKKSSHNEYERDRRKKLNKLYTSLRELLPEKDQKKKLSIPCTIARVLKYIPELQRHIERLKRRKEEILMRVAKDEFLSACNKERISPVISAVRLSGRELMMQTCTLNTRAMVRFSKIARVLEGEGLQIMNASTQTTTDEKNFYTVHIQAKEAMRIEGQIFCEQLMSSHRAICFKHMRSTLLLVSAMQDASPYFQTRLQFIHS